MTVFINELVQEMEQQLEETAKEAEDIVQCSKASIAIVQAAIAQLSEYLILHPLENKAMEIGLFKKIVPRINAKLIYFIRVHQIETMMPDTAIAARRKYFKKQLRNINYYFAKNKWLCQYYKTGENNLDEQLFTRAPFQLELALEEFTLLRDKAIHSQQSFRLARIMAYEELQQYLQQSLRKLKSSSIPSIPRTKTTMQWTDSKAALIELAYALHSSGSLNAGRVGIKQIISFFEQAFEIDLGNFYRVFQGQRIRKNRAAFVEALKESLLKKMDDSD